MASPTFTIEPPQQQNQFEIEPPKAKPSLLQTMGKIAVSSIPVVGKYLEPPPGETRTRGEMAKQDLATAGMVAAPEIFAPAAAGTVGGLGIMRALGRGILSGTGAAAGTMAGQAIQGQNPLDPESLKETAKTGATQAALAVPFEAVGGLSRVKMGRGFINESMGATGRDVVYGNPARAITAEGITNPFTGDFEKYKDALRMGAGPSEAAHAAGGRFAAVSGRIDELSPQLNNLLQASRAPISVATTIDQPFNQAMNQIISNRAMTQAEKDVAINQLGELEKSIKQGIGPTMSPYQANEIKRQIGDRVNWGGNVAVTDEVKPVYKSIYGSLKNAVNKAVPGAAGLNERLTNLYAAQADLDKLARQEEIGSGKGFTGGSWNVLRRIESMGGRILPGASAAAPIAGRTAGAMEMQMARQLKTGELTQEDIMDQAKQGIIAWDAPSRIFRAAKRGISAPPPTSAQQFINRP